MSAIEKGFLGLYVNNSYNTELPDAIKVTDEIVPKYKKYSNESYSIFLEFCDYSNNCRRSSQLLDTTPQVYNGSSANKNSLSDSTKNLTDFDSYQNTNAGIEIKYPIKWSDKISFGKQAGTGDVILAYNSPSEVFSVIKENRVRSESLKQYANALISGNVKRYADFDHVESIPTILSGKVAYKIVYNLTVGQKEFTAMDIVGSNGANIFRISYMCLAQDYSHNVPTILNIIRSFKFIDTDSIVDNPVLLTYENPVAGISMYYKSDWDKHEDAGIIPFSPIVSLISPLEGDQDTYYEQINLYIQDLPPSISSQNDINKYIDYFVPASWSSSHKFVKLPLFVNDTGTLGDGWNLKVYPAMFKDVPVGVTQIWKVVNDKLYRIEFLYELTKYDYYSRVLLEMVKSLRIIPSDSSKWNFLTYEDPSSGIRIQHPFDWRLQPYDPNLLKDRGKIVEFWPPQLNGSYGIASRVDISIYPFSSHVMIDKVANNNVQAYRKIYPTNFNLLKLENYTSSTGLPAFKLVFAASTGENVPFQMMVIGILLEDKLYVFRYSSLPGDFNTFLPKVTHMIKSFQIGFES